MMEPTKEAGSGEKQALGPVVQIDEGRIQAHLDGVVRSTVEEALNALLDAEADHLCGARKYERTEGRKDTRAGSCVPCACLNFFYLATGYRRPYVAIKRTTQRPKGTALPGTGENRQYKRSRRLWRSFSSPFPGSDPAEMRAFRVDLRIVQKSSCFSRLNGGGCSHGRTALCSPS